MTGDRHSDRPPTRTVVVVSPHFDDVPLSLGQSLTDGLLARCRVRVHVAFSRTNWSGWMHPTPGRAGVVSAWRRAEESAASLRFRYRWRAGGWSESVLRTGVLDPQAFLDPELDLDAEPLVGELATWMHGIAVGGGRRRPADLVLVSAGLGGHVDHRIVATAASRLVGSLGVPVGFYEDRPYSAYLDDAERLRQLALLGPDPEAVVVSGPIRASTQRWMRRCYPSQMNSYFHEAMELDRSTSTGERIWFPRGSRPGWV